MNEPTNFDTSKDRPRNWPFRDGWNCPVDEWDDPVYKTAIQGDRLSDKTLCMISEQSNGSHIFRHYDVHTLYGWSQTLATLSAAQATENKRSVVISRSTFPSSGKYGGHWLGDNSAKWIHVKYNIIGMLEFNLFGIPYIGADICGYYGNTSEQLCQRWMQEGAFNPFFRNHNGEFIDQDPGSWSPPVVESNRKVVETRYTLLPYLYTLFYRAHIMGGTVVRSMAHEFPEDSQCWSLDEQFLWGKHLHIAPVIYENHVEKEIYFSGLNSNERWYNYYTGEEMYQTADGSSYITVPAPLNYLPLYLRGGAIIPHQKHALNTQKSELYWDDGESIDAYENDYYSHFMFNYISNRLTLEPLSFNYRSILFTLDGIYIYGLMQTPKEVILNNEVVTSSKWTYFQNTQSLSIKHLQLEMSKTHEIVIY
ncbi:unnamed protein product [Didymodactylos carnosus]|uniref:Sucrase n=2 Tax=Didymodactylos carnosus TaxID=1234261 RepID=A0A814QB61_9BILA|nr:unnamed protein product [Didymodactylos carnosus]CAF3880153.1 unnamed protein product [Didymodactylos carnosus]